jgi:hypothetical protein
MPQHPAGGNTFHRWLTSGQTSRSRTPAPKRASQKPSRNAVPQVLALPQHLAQRRDQPQPVEPVGIGLDVGEQLDAAAPTE